MPKTRKIKIVLFFLLFFSYTYMLHKLNGNETSRYDLSIAIVEQHTVQIDLYQTLTGDKAIFNGHYYSDKSPGISFFGVPVYWFIKQIFHILGFDNVNDADIRTVIWRITLLFIRVVVIDIPSAFLSVCLFSFLSQLPITQRYAIWLTLGYGLGTLAFPYSTVFYGHQFVAVFMFVVFYIIYSIRRFADSPIRPFLFLWIAGFLAGYAVISEYPVILLIPIMIVYLWAKEKNLKSVGIFVSGMVIPALILLYYNHLCTGSFFKLGYSYETSTEFRQGMSAGIAGVTYPKLSALWGITLSLYRGLFLLNPFLLFAILGYFFMYRNPNWRKEFWVSLLAVILFFLFNSSYYMWWGGFALGPRHLVPILPFMVLPIAFIPQKYWKYVCALIIISIIFMWVGTVVDPQVPDSIQNPFFGFAFQQLIHGNVSPNLGMILAIILIPGGVYLLGLVILLGSGWLLKKTGEIENTIS